MGKQDLLLFHLCIVMPLATITPSSVNRTSNRGDTATLMCTSVGGPDNAYQWRANNTDIPGETMKNLTLTNVNDLTGGMYTCVVTNAAGSDSDSTFLFIAPYFITEPVNGAIANGSLTIFQCVAEAFPSPSYQWARTDRVPVRQGLTTDTNILFFNPALFGDEGQYYCNATSREEVAHSQDITLTSMLILFCYVCHCILNCSHYSFSTFHCRGYVSKPDTAQRRCSCLNVH